MSASDYFIESDRCSTFTLVPYAQFDGRPIFCIRVRQIGDLRFWGCFVSLYPERQRLVGRNASTSWRIEVPFGLIESSPQTNANRTALERHQRIFGSIDVHDGNRKARMELFANRFTH